MGHPMMHHHEGYEPWPAFLSIPAPMAGFGVVIAFMFGMTMGTLMGRKTAGMTGMMSHSPHGRMHGMLRHHHHGFGTPACRCGEPPTEPAEKTPLEDLPE